MTLQGALGDTDRSSYFREENRKNPVIGLDAAKGESQVQAFLNKGKPYRKSFLVFVMI